MTDLKSVFTKHERKVERDLDDASRFLCASRTTQNIDIKIKCLGIVASAADALMSSSGELKRWIEVERDELYTDGVFDELFDEEMQATEEE